MGTARTTQRAWGILGAHHSGLASFFQGLLTKHGVHLGQAQQASNPGWAQLLSQETIDE